MERENRGRDGEGGPGSVQNNRKTINCLNLFLMFWDHSGHFSDHFWTILGHLWLILGLICVLFGDVSIVCDARLSSNMQAKAKICKGVQKCPLLPMKHLFCL